MQQPSECVCDITEDSPNGPIYPYMCSDCGKCYQCSHKLIGYSVWICLSGRKKLTTFDEGLPVTSRQKPVI